MVSNDLTKMRTGESSGRLGAAAGRAAAAALALAVVAAMFSTAAARAADPLDQSTWASEAKPTLAFDGERARLRWGEADLVVDGLPAVEMAVHEKRSVNPKNGFWEYEFPKLDVENARTKVDRDNGRITRTYEWGEARVEYELDGHRLNIQLELENKSKLPLADFRVRLATMRIPGKPESLNGKRRDGVNPTNDTVAMLEFKLPQGRMYAAYESFAPDVNFGFGRAVDEAGDVYPLILAGGVHIQPRNDVVLPPRGIPTIPPGETLRLRVSIRLADAKARQHDVLRQLYRDWRAFQSPMLDWPDRRPIGDAYLLSEFGKAAPAFGQEGINPRRWWSPMLDVVEMDSPHGRSMLRRELRELAYKSVATLKRMGAQGAILWNAEGAFHETGWVGDPRMLPILSPELDKAIDDYFKIVRDAGLKTGVTLRHGHVVWRGNKWTQNPGNFNPRNNATLDDFMDLINAHPHEPWWRVYPVARRMSAKIAYAKKRWGCTIFYIDTSLITRGRGVNQRMSHKPITNHIYRKIREDHPDVLIIPELSELAHIGHVGPYGQLPYRKVRPRYDGHWTMDIYPTYFGYHRVSDYPVWNTRVDRAHEVAWGEILGMSASHWSDNSEALLEVYKEAGAAQRRATAVAKRFGVIDRPEDQLALSFAIRDARPLTTNHIVADPPASSQMRAFAAVDDERREALVMIGFLGYPHAPGVTLKPDLPGLGLDGDSFEVWDVESGDLISDGEAIRVPADPVTGFHLLRVRATDRTPTSRPAGLRLAASFDRGGLDPDQGGGLIDDHGDAAVDAGAMQLRPGAGVARYGVVPDWEDGTLEFDLRVRKAGDDPMPLATLAHYMDTRLELVRRNGRPALRLITMERGFLKTGREESLGLMPDVEKGHVAREAVAELPAGDGWRHVTLAWEVGQYRLFIDGKLAATISAPAAVRWRDGTVYEPGLIFGGKAGGDAHAEVDSVMLYDWAFDDLHAAKRRGRVGLDAVEMPVRPRPTVWLWGEKPEKVERVAVNARSVEGGERAVRISAELFEKTDAGLRKLSGKGVAAHNGSGTVLMDYDPKAPPAGDMDLQAGQDDDDDPFGELGAMVDETVYVLRVKVRIVGAPNVEEDIEFKFDGNKSRRW